MQATDALPADLPTLRHVVSHRSTRDEWKAWSFDALPPHAGPRLVFDPFDEPVTWFDHHAVSKYNPDGILHSSIELDQIVADQLAYHRSSDGNKRAQLAQRIRRRWCRLVDHAIGYRFQGDPHTILEFT